MKPSRMIIFLAILTASILWGLVPTVSKILLKQLDPVAIVFFRLIIASIIIFPFFLKEQRAVKKFELKLIPILFLATLNWGLFIIGLNHTTANAPGIFYTATPLIALLLAKVFLNEKVNIWKIAGIFIGLLGVLMILVISAIKKNELLLGSPFGNLIVFGAVLSFAGYTVGSRYLSKNRGYSPLYLLSISIFLATLSFTFVAILRDHALLTPAFTPVNLMLLGYLGIFTTITTYFLYQWVIKHSSVTMSSLTTYLQPPIVFFFAWIFLGTPLAWEFVVGTIVTFFGVFLATFGTIRK